MNAISEKPHPSVPPNMSSTAAPDASGDAPPKRRLRPALRVVLPLVLLAAAAVAGNWWFAEGRFIASTDNAYVQGDIAVLGPRIEGDVLAIPVADNQFVKAGDPLIVLDPTDWQAKLDQARGTAAEAAASVETARSQAEQSRSAITQAGAMIAQSDAELTRATADAGRTASLVGGGWTSRQANDLAVADRRKAEASVAAMHAQRASAVDARAVAQAQIVQAQAREQTADAAVKLAASNLAYTVIRAPFDGIVGNRAAQLGQHVLPQLQLISVTPPAQKLYVLANFKETQLARMRAGQKVVLTPDIDSSAAVTGRVDSMAPATGALFSLLPPENATGNFTKVVQRVPVKIVIDPAQAANAGWLRAGLSVTAEVDTRAPDAHRVGIFGAAAATLGIH